ncbi:flagellar biosynthesis regulator FlaF [Algirhabdus cladophorae]|uniref:flagellar biosynthesis regulator FlaF n=1 Tax=Algirhabdus cladophorae TaxID=3377108 RepID=UPI003B848EF0
MNAYSLARSGYGASAAPIRTPKSLEYEAFARVTRRLRKVALAASPSHIELVEAIHENRKLWTLLASMVAEPDNGLPDKLRAQIFYLADFTSQHSRKILKGQAKPDALVDINVAIMRGLKTEGTKK